MKWEYKTIKLAHDSFFVGKTPSFENVEIDKFINQYGEQGWELVSTVGVLTNLKSQPLNFQNQIDLDNVVILFFKRPLAK